MNVLVTGANRGIGLGFVKHYLNGGHDVWACFRQDPGGLKELDTRRLRQLRWDVTEDKDEEFLVAAGIPEQLDLLINNAGIYGPDGDGQTLENITAQTMREVFDVDCVGALQVTQVLWKRMCVHGGVIANVSSKMGSSADNSSGGCYAYRAAKAALVICSKSMAIDLAPHGIDVVTLHPGWVRTDMTDHNGLITVAESVTGMARVIERIADFSPGAFVAFDGKIVPY